MSTLNIHCFNLYLQKYIEQHVFNHSYCCPQNSDYGEMYWRMLSNSARRRQAHVCAHTHTQGKDVHTVLPRIMHRPELRYSKSSCCKTVMCLSCPRELPGHSGLGTCLSPCSCLICSGGRLLQRAQSSHISFATGLLTDSYCLPNNK